MRRASISMGVITLLACSHDATAPNATHSSRMALPQSTTPVSGEWMAQVVEISPARGEFRGINDSGVAVGTWDGAAWQWKAGRLTRLFAGEAAKINNVGWVVGTSAEEIPGMGHTTNAVLWRNGSAQVLRDAGWQYSRGLDVNDEGVVIGNFQPEGTSYLSRSFFWDHGAYSYPCVFNFTEVVRLSLSALADTRAAVGNVQFGSDDVRAVYCSPSGTAINLDPSTPSLEFSSGTDINNRGQLLVNRSIGRPQPLAYLWEAGIWTALPLPPGGNWAQATAMNETGLVVGEFCCPAGEGPYAFVVEDGVAVDLHQVFDSTALGSYAADVNERGEVVGYVIRRLGPLAPQERLPVIWRRVSVASRLAGLHEMIAALETSGALNRGQANALTVKVDAAQRGFEGGRGPSTVNQLSAFLNQVDAWRRSGLVSAEQAEALQGAAEELISAIEREGDAS